MSVYQPRLLDAVLVEYLEGLPAVSIDGARGVGKTELAQRQAATAFRLDDPDVALRLASDPDLINRVAAPVLIDEWQLLPRIWNDVRRSVDRDYSAGRFILTGSAVPGAGSDSLHSGAGRIVRVQLRPFSLVERGLAEPFVALGSLLDGQPATRSADSMVTFEQYLHEIQASGFPAIRTLPDRLRNVQLDSYLSNILEHGFMELGVSVRRPAVLRAWLRAYAAATATTTMYSTILDAATAGEADKPARSTTDTWRNALSNLWLLDPIPAWLPGGNLFGRLASSPKHFLVDPALAVRLLGLDLRKPTQVEAPVPQRGSIYGNLFESLVAQSLQTYAQVNDARLHHFRNHDGSREVDFIIERGSSVVAIEVKLAPSVNDRDVRHLNWLQERIGDRLVAKVLLNSGRHAYTRPDGVLVLPAALLGA